MQLGAERLQVVLGVGADRCSSCRVLRNLGPDGLGELGGQSVEVVDDVVDDQVREPIGDPRRLRGRRVPAALPAERARVQPLLWCRRSEPRSMMFTSR